MKTWKAAFVFISALTAIILTSMPFLGQLNLSINLNQQGGEQQAPAASSDTGNNQSAGNYTTSTGGEPEAEPMRGVWVATVLNLDYPSEPGLSAENIKAEATDILDNAQEMGFNAIFLQVRPSGDALYKSDIFPWSYYLTGNQGGAPENGFDPLTFWVEEAHKRGLELHAWVNPFRITRGTKTEPSQDILSLAASNPARQHPEWVVKYSDGSMYYDPGIPEVRELIVRGVKELAEKYDIDGVHYDDYFYPAVDFPDSQTFAKYGSNYSDIGDWRRDNVNNLIKETYEAVKGINPNVRFGVSPSGIWANKKNNPDGSDTTGSESYYLHYADSRKWVKMGWLDYICPQIYWEIGNLNADYAELLSWWVNVADGTKTDLYIGHAAYKCGSTEPGSAWQGTDELKRQFKLNAIYKQVKGSVCFRYAFFRDYKELCEFITAWNMQAQSAFAISGAGLSVGRPENDVSTALSTYYVLGSSDPKKPLYLNGSEVKTRTEQGYFGLPIKLDYGENALVFTQGGKNIVRTITRAEPSPAAPKKLDKAAIVSGSAYPSVYNEYRMPGEKVTLKCLAPIGAAVTASLGGVSYTLTPAATKKPANGIYATTFSCTYTLPENSGTGKVINIGTPVYTMKYGRVTSSAAATGAVCCILPGAPYCAEVITDTAFTYASNTTSGGPVGELTRGQRDSITAVTNGGTWIRLGGTGQWILRSQVERKMEETAYTNRISGAGYECGEKWDKAIFYISSPAATAIDYNGTELKLKFSSAPDAPRLNLPSGSLFSSVSSGVTGGNAQYVFTLKEVNGVNGYYISVDEGSITLNIKKKPELSGGDKPLAGMTIMIDPGHGGTSKGALGPLGSEMPEKFIVLSCALKIKDSIEKLGAQAVLTRDSDTDVSLEERLSLTRETKPDLFISIHNNSANEDVDCTDKRGIGSYYSTGVSKNFAEFIQKYLADSLDIPSRAAYEQNLYVCRPYWTPAVLIETSFISNPVDFEWLTDEDEQDRLADAVAAGICAYFG